MIVKLKGGGQIVLTECHWVPGAYLSAGSLRGSQGAILRPAELDQLIAGVAQIRAAIAERAAAKFQRARKQRRAA